MPPQQRHLDRLFVLARPRNTKCRLLAVYIYTYGKCISRGVLGFLARTAPWVIYGDGISRALLTGCQCRNFQSRGSTFFREVGGVRSGRSLFLMFRGAVLVG